jgi:hypothetical protein
MSYQVKNERITNDQVRKRFYDIPCVKNMIAERHYHSLGKLYEILTHFDLQNYRNANLAGRKMSTEEEKEEKRIRCCSRPRHYVVS